MLFGNMAFALAWIVLDSSSVLQGVSAVAMRSYEVSFGTDRFLFVGLSNCHLTVERSPLPGKCTYHASYQTSTVFSSESLCRLMKMHLWLGDKEEPKALIIASSSSGNLVAQFQKIHWPVKRVLEENYFSGEHITLSTSSSVSDADSNNINNNNFYWDFVRWTLFDTHYRLLHVLRNTSAPGYRIVHCITFLVQLSGHYRRPRFHYMGTVDVHQANDRRDSWTEDPYGKKFYYTETVDEVVALYSVRFADIIKVLMNGVEGKLEEIPLIGAGIYLSVSRGIAISYANHGGKVKQFIHEVGNKTAIVCEHNSPQSQLNPSVSISLLFNEDYCLVKGTMDKCDGDHQSAQSDKASESEGLTGSSSIVIWLCVVVLILFTIVLILGVYIFRQRRADAEELSFSRAERPQIHYYPTFISDPSVDF